MLRYSHSNYIPPTGHIVELQEFVLEIISSTQNMYSGYSADSESANVDQEALIGLRIGIS